MVTASPGTSNVCIARSTQRSRTGGAPDASASAPAGETAARESTANAARRRLRALECLLLEAVVDNVFLPKAKVCGMLPTWDEHWSLVSDLRTHPRGGLLQRFF